MSEQKLVWDDKYSVGVKLIDEQHKMLFDVINELISVINTTPSDDKIADIIEQIIQYKKNHFETEEKFFKECDYEKTEDHVAQHQMFNEKVNEIQEQNQDDPLTFAFELVDFLEDWLIDHLMNVDQEYVACFQAHGLK